MTGLSGSAETDREIVMPISRRDAQMVRRVLKGDNDAYAELVNAYQGQAVAMALHLCGDFETAQDLAQEAFLQAYRSLAGLKHPAAFRAWLYGILRNVCRKHLSRRPPPAASLQGNGVPEPSAPADDSVEMRSVLNTLDLEHRELLAARYLLEMDYKEIAQMLGITVNNVRVRCFRAKQALRAALAGDGGVASG